MEKFYLSLLMASMLSLVAEAHMVTFYLDDQKLDSVNVADGYSVDLEAYNPGPLLPFETVEFAGWSTVNDPKNPVFFSPNEVVNDRLDLYAMFYMGEPTISAVPLQSMAELDSAIAGNEVLYPGCLVGEEAVYFIADPAGYSDDLYDYYTSVVSIETWRSEILADGTIKDFDDWNKVMVYAQPAGNGYKLMVYDKYLGLYADENANRVYPATSSADTSAVWDISFDEQGVVSMLCRDSYLTFSDSAWSFVGVPSEVGQMGTLHLYHLVSGPQEYTNGFKAVQLLPNDSIYLGYSFANEMNYNVARIEAEYVNDVMYPTLYLLNGYCAKLISMADMADYEFDHWASNIPDYDGDTARILNVCPVPGMTLGAVYSKVEYWNVTLLNMPENTSVVPYNEEEVYVWEENLFYETRDSLGNLVYGVRKGSSLPLTYYCGKEKALDHWVSSDSRYDGSQADPLIVAPQEDMTLSVVLQDAEYFCVALPRTLTSLDSAMVAPLDQIDEYLKEEDVYPVVEPMSPHRHPVENMPYYINYKCSQEGDSCYLAYYILKGRTVAVFALFPAMHNDCRFDHWISSDSTVNGSKDRILYLTPTGDMTLDFAVSEVGVPTVINGDTIRYSDTASVAVDVYGDGSVVLTMNDEYGESTMTFDGASVQGEGLSTELTSLVLDVQTNSTVQSSDYGVRFDGVSLSIVSGDSAMLTIRAPQPLVGNGLSRLFINARVIFRSTHMAASGPRRMVAENDSLAPAVSGFSEVTLGDSIELQEVWYGDEQGDASACVYNAAEQAYGEVDVQSQQFVPATTLVFSDNNFYVDYIDGKIDDVESWLMQALRSKDTRCFDILGREIREPQQGLYIRGGRVWLR